jgi:ribosomal protein L7Ae-like RNA K-turn-binding protein
MDKQLLPLLGLCKRAGMMEVGEEPVEAAARAKHARVLLLASDAADNTRRRVEHFAAAGACLWLRVPFTKEELGRAVGRTSCAVLAVTDIGFAANIVRRLAQTDPARYGEAAERLDIKAKRAAERKAEMLAHERNVRRGKFAKKAPPPAERVPAPERKPEADRRSRRPGGQRKPARPGERPAGGSGASRTFRSGGPRRGGAKPYANSRPVKKGKGSPRQKRKPAQ